MDHDTFDKRFIRCGAANSRTGDTGLPVKYRVAVCSRCFVYTIYIFFYLYLYPVVAVGKYCVVCVGGSSRTGERVRVNPGTSSCQTGAAYNNASRSSANADPLYSTSTASMRSECRLFFSPKKI